MPIIIIIANVPFISKVIEKIVACQLTSYLETSNLLPTIQSGFRKGHSTETLLLHLLSDIYGAIDRSQLTLLALFDVSAAFDTVDHEILSERLQITFGLSGAFLCWLEFFLGERTLCVVHGPTRPPWVPTPIGYLRAPSWDLSSLYKLLTLLHCSLSSVLWPRYMQTM